MKNLLLLLLLVCISSCSQVDPNSSFKPSEKERTANKAIKKAAKQIEEELGLYPFGTGGQMMYDIQMLALAFNYYKPITVEEGRELLIRAVDIFVDAVNADERIRPYLANYPFEPKNIQIRIFLRNRNGSNPEPGKFAVITAIDNIFEYDIRDPETKRLKAYYKETYDKALERPSTANLDLSPENFPKKEKLYTIEGISFCG